MTEEERRLLVAIADALAIVLIRNRNPTDPINRGAHLAWDRLQEAMVPFGPEKLWLQEHTH